MLSFTGDEKAIRQLLSILLDNALKYSADGAPLTLGLEKQGRAILLTVSNTVDKPIDRDKLPHLFDRFYRMDPPQQRDGRLRPGAVHRQKHRAGPQGKNPGGKPRRHDADLCGASAFVNY